MKIFVAKYWAEIDYLKLSNWVEATSMVESALRDIIGWASMIYFESAYICRFSSSVCANQPRDLKNESAHIVFFCFDKQILALGIQPACDEGRKVANKDLES